MPFPAAFYSSALPEWSLIHPLSRGGHARGGVAYTVLQRMDTATLTGLIVLVLLVLANGFFVATEFAIVAVRRSRLDELAAQGVPNAGAAKQVVGHLDTYIAACQLGITMASLALGWVGEPALAHLIEPPMEALVGQFAPAAAHGVAIGASFAVITALHIVIGELAPKGLALQRPEATALWVARPMQLFEFVFRWPIALLNGIGNGVLRLAGLQPASGHEMVHTVSELRLLVAGSQQAGVVEESEARIASRAFTLADHTAGALMTPRTEVDAVPLEASREELIERVTASPHSRLPVYEGSLDSVVGILHVHDLVPGLARPPETFSLRPLLRPPLFVPESKHADELLDEMRASRQQFAVVLEEYGGHRRHRDPGEPPGGPRGPHRRRARGGRPGDARRGPRAGRLGHLRRPDPAGRVGGGDGAPPGRGRPGGRRDAGGAGDGPPGAHPGRRRGGPGGRAHPPRGAAGRAPRLGCAPPAPAGRRGASPLRRRAVRRPLRLTVRRDRRHRGRARRPGRRPGRPRVRLPVSAWLGAARGPGPSGAAPGARPAAGPAVPPAEACSRASRRGPQERPYASRTRGGRRPTVGRCRRDARGPRPAGRSEGGRQQPPRQAPRRVPHRDLAPGVHPVHVAAQGHRVTGEGALGQPQQGLDPAGLGAVGVPLGLP